MTVRVNKSSFNIREKLSELGRKFGLKGSELVAAETVQEAREIVSAGRKNLVINGDMRVAQRATTATGMGSGFTFNTIDRWMMRNNGTTTARYTNTRSTDSPSSGGFKYSYKLEVTTAKGTLSSNWYQGVAIRIEGQSLQHLCFGTSNAKHLTLSFWVKSNTTGQYSCHISNWNNSKNISRPYTIDTPNTWEKKTITIPGDTATAIPNDNGIGLEIGWCLATTSYYNDGTDGGGWHATSDAGKRHSGQVVEFGGTIGDTWYLSGVQLEVGKNATEFEHRSYGEELALCQRYYETTYPPTFGEGHNFNEVYPFPNSRPLCFNFNASDDTTTAQTMRFRVDKRAYPTVRLFSAKDGASNNALTYKATGGNNINHGISVVHTQNDHVLIGTQLGAVNQTNESYFHVVAESEL